jgi:hypothetical protein
MDCFVASLLATTHLRHCERSEAIQRQSNGLDCFVAEPVIGPATSGRTRWLLAMTVLIQSDWIRAKIAFIRHREACMDWRH